MRTIMEMKDAKKNMESELLKTIYSFEKEFGVAEQVGGDNFCVGVFILLWQKDSYL